MKDAMTLLGEEINDCTYHRMCGLHVLSLGEGFAEIIMDPSKDVLNPMGKIHGGAIFSLCDVAAGVAAATHGMKGVTQCSSMNFLRPGHGDRRLIARTRELKKGRKTAVYEVTVTDSMDEEVAVALMTMYFVG